LSFIVIVYEQQKQLSLGVIWLNWPSELTPHIIQFYPVGCFLMSTVVGNIRG